MLCSEVIKVIEEVYPRSLALEWDNPGLQAGSLDREIGRIYVAVDAVEETIEGAVSSWADLLVTHHPMIFSSLKRVVEEDFTGRRIIRMIQANLSCYAMHTNYDVVRMAELAGEKMNLKDREVLEVTCPESPVDGRPLGIGTVACLNETIPIAECCELVKENFLLDSVKVFGELKKKVRRVAICPGSGKSMISAALKKQADVLITGDIDHHTGIDSVAQGLAIIDAGHYGLEHIFIQDVADFLRSKLTGVEVIEAPIRHPFRIV